MFVNVLKLIGVFSNININYLIFFILIVIVGLWKIYLVK